MNKNDLRTGMRVKLRDGFEGTILLDTCMGSLIAEGQEYFSLQNILGDLSHVTNRNFDIVLVYENTTPYKLNSTRAELKVIWERSDVEEITAEEAMKRLEESSGKKIKIIR